MKKIRKNFYLNKTTDDLLRELSYKMRKPQTRLIEESIELLKREYKWDENCHAKFHDKMKKVHEVNNEKEHNASS